MTDKVSNDPLGTVVIAFRSLRGQIIEGQTIDISGGQLGTWIVTYTAGTAGIDREGGLRIWRHPQKFWLGQIKQSRDPVGQDYCSVSTDGRCHVELVHVERDYKTHAIAHLRVVKGRLGPGEHIVFRVGDTSGGAPPTTIHPTRQPHCRLRVDVDSNGTGQYAPLSRGFCVSITAGKAARLSMVAPSHMRLGQPSPAYLRFEDENCNPGAPYVGRVLLTCTDPAAGLPGEVAVTADNRGLCTLQGVRQLDVAGQALRLLEITSMHRSREWFAQYLLSAGYRLGFTGGSDGHFGCPGYDVWPLHGVASRLGGASTRCRAPLRGSMQMG